jgi:ribulose kinase
VLRAMPNSERNAQHLQKRIHLTGKFSGERPSIANPTERAMVDEGVEVIVV